MQFAQLLAEADFFLAIALANNKSKSKAEIKVN
jgi:hypothetical protein